MPRKSPTKSSGEAGSASSRKSRKTIADEAETKVADDEWAVAAAGSKSSRANALRASQLIQDTFEASGLTRKPSKGQWEPSHVVEDHLQKAGKGRKGKGRREEKRESPQTMVNGI